MLQKNISKKNSIAVQAAIPQRFNHVPPCKKTFQQNVKNTIHMERAYIETENSGRRRTARSEENIEQVRNMLENNPRSISAMRNSMGLSAETLSRIACKELR